MPKIIEIGQPEDKKKKPGYIVNKERLKTVLKDIQAVFKKYELSMDDVTYVIEELVGAIKHTQDVADELAINNAIGALIAEIKKRKDL